MTTALALEQSIADFEELLKFTVSPTYLQSAYGFAYYAPSGGSKDVKHMLGCIEDEKWLSFVYNLITMARTTTLRRGIIPLSQQLQLQMIVQARMLSQLSVSNASEVRLREQAKRKMTPRERQERVGRDLSEGWARYGD